MDETKAFIAVLVVAGVLSLFGIWIGYYTHAVVPLRMAEKGLCWDNAVSSYQPCREAK